MNNANSFHLRTTDSEVKIEELFTPEIKKFPIRKRIELVELFRAVQDVLKKESYVLSGLTSSEKKLTLRIIEELGISVFMEEISCYEDFTFMPVGDIDELKEKLRAKLLIVTGNKIGSLRKKTVFLLARTIILKSEYVKLLPKKYRSARKNLNEDTVLYSLGLTKAKSDFLVKLNMLIKGLPNLTERFDFDQKYQLNNLVYGLKVMSRKKVMPATTSKHYKKDLAALKNELKWVLEVITTKRKNNKNIDANLAELYSLASTIAYTLK